MLSVMIVDDESVIRKGIACLIDWPALGCEVVCQAANGREAHRYLEGDAVDIVVSDIRMPEMDGLQLAQFIHETLPATQVILLTAYADFSYAQAAIRWEVVDYVIKTQYVEKLPEAVRKACSRLRGQKEKEASLQKLQHSLQADVEEKCEAFLKDVMNGLPIGHDMLQARAGQLNLWLPHYRVMAFELNEAQEGTQEASAEEQNQFTRSIRNFLSLALKAYPHHLLFMSGSMIVAVVSFSDTRLDTALNELLLCGNEILGVADGFAKFTINIGISEMHHALWELPDAWQQARDALAGIFYGDSRISVYLQPSAQPRMTVPGATYPLIDGMIDALRQGDAERALSVLEELLASYRSHKTPMEHVKTTGMILCSACFRLIAQAGRGTDAQVGGEVDAYRGIQESKSLSRLSCVLQDLIRTTAASLRDGRKSEHPLVKQIDRFIRAHYNESINLQRMAEHVHVNASYLSSLYKKQTGEPLIDALNRYRIDMAKQLLRGSDKKVMEVAQAVGIEDPAYFTHVFTRYAGLSPKEYRSKGDAG